MPWEPALLASEAWRAKRGQHGVSEGHDARSERPASGAWATPNRRRSALPPSRTGGATVEQSISTTRHHRETP